MDEKKKDVETPVAAVARELYTFYPGKSKLTIKEAALQLQMRVNTIQSYAGARKPGYTGFSRKNAGDPYRIGVDDLAKMLVDKGLKPRDPDGIAQEEKDRLWPGQKKEMKKQEKPMHSEPTGKVAPMSSVVAFDSPVAGQASAGASLEALKGRDSEVFSPALANAPDSAIPAVKPGRKRANAFLNFNPAAKLKKAISEAGEE